MDHRIELLAPAGNPEGFRGAIHAGADAVYLSGKRFGARAYADNFTSEELLYCIRYAHILGRKVYLTVNTLVKETELDDLFPCLLPLYEAGLDGVIVQDFGVFRLIREHFPQLKLHVSTQMTVTSGQGAAFLKKLGAERIVPARELSLEEIRTLKETSGAEVETFVHGAMCYCYSGQCLFSSILGGRSGNRGRCAGPCRLPYRVERGGRLTGECYPLSLKDLCTIESLPELIEAGIDSFKIEGRMKKPEYTAGVTRIYRKYIDRYYETQDREFLVEPEDLEQLSNLYIRSERMDGYYHRHNGRSMVTLTNPSYGGSDEELFKDLSERFCRTGPKIALRMEADFLTGQPAVCMLTLSDGRAKTVSVQGDTVPAAANRPITEENIRKQLSKLGDTMFEAKDIAVTLNENAFYPLKEINALRRQAVTLLENQLITEHGFAVSRSDAIIPPACDILSDTPVSSEAQGSYFQENGAFHVVVRTQEQLESVLDFAKNFAKIQDKHENFRGISAVYIEEDLIFDMTVDRKEHLENVIRDGVSAACGELSSYGCACMIAMPFILRERDTDRLVKLWQFYTEHRELFSGFLARSIDGLAFLADRGYGRNPGERIRADAGLYLWNREAVRFFEDEPGQNLLGGFCMPYELNAAEQHRLLEAVSLPCEKIIYGRIPLMISANCIAKTIDGCDKNTQGEPYYLTDRYHKRFPVVRSCAHCMNILYNCVPLSLHREYKKWERYTAFRIDLTVEDGKETARILRFFTEGAEGVPPYEEYTGGHEKRGAE